MDLNIQTLLAGGAIAAVAGFWSQVKSALHQVSGLFLVQATLDNVVAFNVQYYLKENYRTLPTGLIKYHTYLHFPRNGGVGLNVPFRLPNSPWTVYYRKGSLVVFGGYKILGVRGLSDIDGLVKKAMTALEQRNAKTFGDRPLRFHIVNVTGQDRKAMYNQHHSGQAQEIRSSNNNAPASDGNDLNQLIMELDKPLMHDRSSFTHNPKVSDAFEHLYFEEDVWAHISQAKRWARLGDWYADRSIPWRRGWVLCGPPGTGKSSLVRALGESLGMPVYVYHLSTLSDSEFMQAWSDMDLPAIALMEDFDTIFNGRQPLSEHGDLSFDTILNCISGTKTTTGLFTIITTNHIEVIDPALGIPTELAGGISTRPGRMDTVVHLEHIGRDNKRKMAARILRDWPASQAKVLLQAQDLQLTPSQFQEMCVQEAFTMLRANEQASLQERRTDETHTRQPQLDWVLGAHTTNKDVRTDTHSG